jgi:hypothetical protein
VPVLRSVRATRYVTPLREGGSLPGLVEADDDGMYVVKFTGAGQGTAALVAEVVVGELGRRIGVRVPDLVGVELDPVIGMREPDQEVQELLKASEGLNLGLDFLPGSVGYDGVAWRPDPVEAARVFWLDAYTANIDRTWRNPNLLVWHRRLWAIDHGSALYFHHAWTTEERFSLQPYDATDHILRGYAGGIGQADEELAPVVTQALLTEVVDLVPEEWLASDTAHPSVEATRRAYVAFLLARLGRRPAWLPAAAA